MKRIFVLAFATLILLPMFLSAQDIPMHNGRYVSPDEAQQMMLGTWKIAYFYDSLKKDKEAVGMDAYLHFQKNGIFEETASDGPTNKGTWNLYEKNSEIEVTLQVDQTKKSRAYKVVFGGKEKPEIFLISHRDGPAGIPFYNITVLEKSDSTNGASK